MNQTAKDIIFHKLPSDEPLDIHIIENVQHCQQIAKRLKRDCREKNVLGFACKYSSMGKAVLLQLISTRGLCALIQLSKQTISYELHKILKDQTILKVGTKTYTAVSRLKLENVYVDNTLDLRHLANELNYNPGTLTQLSKKHLKNDEQKENNRQLANTDLQKQIYTNWSAELSNADKYVAATNVQNVILLFKKFEGELMGNFYSSNGMKSFADIYRPYLNEDYPKREDLKIQNIGQSPTPQDIRIVNNAEECKAVLNELKQHADENNAVGFDCEWVPQRKGKQRPKIALLQLASHRGLCALIRLCKFKTIPKELKDFLKDGKIKKVGVETKNDAEKLHEDYGIVVEGDIDLHEKAIERGYREKGLKALSHHFLGIKLEHKGKGLKILKLHKKWEDDTLDEININYAAIDAYVSIELYKEILKQVAS